MAPAVREMPVVVNQAVSTPDAQPATSGPDNTFMWTNLVIRTAEFAVGSIIMFVGIAALLKSGMRR